MRLFALLFVPALFVGCGESASSSDPSAPATAGAPEAAAPKDIGTVLATQYTSRVDSILDDLPDAIPESARSAASESIIATDQVLAAAQAQGAPAELVSTVRDRAYEAFLLSSHVTYVISMALVVVAALVVAFVLPRISPPRKDDEPNRPDASARRVPPAAGDGKPAIPAEGP